MGFMNKLAEAMKFSNDNDDDEYDTYEDDDDYVEEPEPKKSSEETPIKVFEKKNQNTAPKRKVLMNDTSVCVFKPVAFDEARNIVETLLQNNTVLLNFEGVDLAVSQRILDIVTGACIAVNGNLQKISNYIFIATPASVDVSGKFEDTLFDAFDSI